VIDPQGPSTGTFRMFRGGSWLESGDQVRAAYRNWTYPNAVSYSNGFRVVLSEVR